VIVSPGHLRGHLAGRRVEPASILAIEAPGTRLPEEALTAIGGGLGSMGAFCTPYMVPAG